MDDLKVNPQEIKNRFRDHFVPKINQRFERYKFNQKIAELGEIKNAHSGIWKKVLLLTWLLSGFKLTRYVKSYYKRRCICIDIGSDEKDVRKYSEIG
jgi:hypothetical protein